MTWTRFRSRILPETDGSWTFDGYKGASENLRGVLAKKYDLATDPGLLFPFLGRAIEAMMKIWREQGPS